MNGIQLDETDLRLLRVLAAILEAGEVSQAAIRLGVSPSAVSHSLRLLRKRLDDPLFVRSGGRLRPTPFATSLRPTLQTGMAQLGQVFDHQITFDPSRSTRTVSLAVPDHPLFTLLPGIIAALRKAAPGVDVRLCTIRPDVREQLANGTLDLVLAGADVEATLALDREVMRSRIMSERFRCVMRSDHPATRSERLLLADYLAAPHVLVSQTGDGRDVVDSVLARLGVRRRVAVTLPSFLTAAWFAAASDLIATLPESIAQRAADRADVVTRDPPIELPNSVAYLWWDPRFQQDPGQVWWRKLLMDAFAPYRP